MIATLVAVTSNAYGYDLGYHEDITRRALSAAGFSRAAQRVVVNGNLGVDIFVNTPGTTRVFPSLKKLHFDDRFRFSSHKALRDELNGRWAAVSRLDCSKQWDVRVFLEILAVMHHALQDYYAHSNHVEVVSLATSTRVPTTFDDVLTMPGWDTLRNVWSQDIPSDVGEALMSGAYFTSPPPDLDDDQGQPAQLTHAALHKDKVGVAGPYLYSRMNRTSTHHQGILDATKEMTDLVTKLNRINARCVSEAANYSLSVFEWHAFLTQYLRFQFYGRISGHWRSGDSVVVGDNLSVDIDTPTYYPDKESPARTTFSYAVTNTGVLPITRFELSATDPVLASPETPPNGWQVSRGAGQSIIWTTSATNALAPNETVTFEITPRPKAWPGFLELETNNQQRVVLLGPTLPSAADGELIGVLAIVLDKPRDAVFDAFGIPTDRQRIIEPTPIQPSAPLGTVQPGNRGCGCQAGSRPGFPIALLLLTFGVVLWPRRDDLPNRR